MNELLKEKLSILVDNEILLKAIRTVFDERIEREKPEVNDTDNDSILGQKYRAYEAARWIIYQAFIDIMSYKINRNSIKSFNKEK